MVFFFKVVLDKDLCGLSPAAAAGLIFLAFMIYSFEDFHDESIIELTPNPFFGMIYIFIRKKASRLFQYCFGKFFTVLRGRTQSHQSEARQGLNQDICELLGGLRFDEFTQIV
jgi:hypothetical protein